MENTRPGDTLSFEVKVAGELIALRFAVASLFMEHPRKEQLLSSLREILQRPGSGAEQLEPPVQVWFDRVVAELSSHLTHSPPT